MSEEANEPTETNTDSATDDGVDMNALAAEAMGLDISDEGDVFDDDDDTPEGIDDDAPSERGAAETADTAPAPAEAAPATTEPAKPKVVEPDAAQKRLDAMMARAERREQDALQRAIDAERQAALVERERDALKEQAKILSVAERDPQVAFDTLMRAAGKDPEKAWREMIERRTEGRSDLSLERIREEAMAAARAEVQKDRDSAKQRNDAAHASRVQGVMAMQQNPEVLAQYPALMSLTPRELQSRIDTAYRRAANPPQGLEHLSQFLHDRTGMLKALDEYEDRLYRERQQRRGHPASATATEGPAAAQPEHSEAPGQAPDAATSRRQSRTITNDDTATGSGARRQKSARQLRAELNELAEANI